MILYKWKIFAVLGKMNVVQESLNAEQRCSSAASRSIEFKKQLYNNKKHIEILELQGEREKLIALSSMKN